jgi:hypothetical protein
MKRRASVAIVVAIVVVGSSPGAFADLGKNPYESIVARNPFGLRPIPPPKAIEVEPTPVAPLSEIKLLGITTLLTSSKALFQYEDWQTKKVEFPSPLSEGDTYKTFSVLAIDVENQRVRIRNGGTQTTLDFVNNGVKAIVVATAPAPTPRLLPPHHVPPSDQPNPVPNDPSAPNARSGVIVLGPLPVESPSPNSSRPRQQTALPPAMSREEAEALIEIARQKSQMQEKAGQPQRGQPASQIFPPTSVGNALQQPSAFPLR